MRVFISLLMLLLINNYHSQDINKQIEGSWEVKKIDGKIFKGGVITYFEFNNQQEIFAKTIDRKAHGHLEKDTFIGNYIVENNKAYYKTNDSYFLITINNSIEQQMIIKEYKLIGGFPKKEIHQTSYLTKKD
ncbi:MAG: hypothetical protein P8M12_03265 [Flavobacteriales bacterium]|jgi:hypothetical protein|nr:hypothetical protein [Flavobacteriales bacterium]